MNRAEALKVALAAGCCIEKNNRHLYYSKDAKAYLILNFSNRGDLLHEDEEEFSDINQAVARFIEVANVNV